MIEDPLFLAMAGGAGVSHAAIEAMGNGNVRWRMATPKGHQEYRRIDDLPDCMPPFAWGRITGRQTPTLRMMPLMSMRDDEDGALTYVSEGGCARVWLADGIMPTTYLNAIGGMKGMAVSGVVGHPAFDGCVIDRVCAIGGETMIGFSYPG